VILRDYFTTNSLLKKFIVPGDNCLQDVRDTDLTF